jgi:hypothetical protein
MRTSRSIFSILVFEHIGRRYQVRSTGPISLDGHRRSRLGPWSDSTTNNFLVQIFAWHQRQGRLISSTSRASWRSLGRARGPVASFGQSGLGRARRYTGGSAPARRPTPGHRGVTFVNGRGGDICIWWTQAPALALFSGQLASPVAPWAPGV